LDATFIVEGDEDLLFPVAACCDVFRAVWAGGYFVGGEKAVPTEDRQ
jgi:hypothetical protein